VHPFLQDNETQIDDFISSAHDRAKQAGVEYLKQAIELIKIHVFGLPPKEPTPPSTPSTYSYTQSLIARFNLPSARPSFPVGGSSTAGDFYSLLASAVTAATSGQAATSKVTDLSNSGTLIPPSLQASSERLTFISAQRERLNILLSALDKEASTLQPHSSSQNEIKPSTPRRVESRFFDGNIESEAEEEGIRERPKSAMSGLSKSKSENDFENIDAESGTEEVENTRRQTMRRGVSSGGGSWMPWSWGAKADEQHGADTPFIGTNKDGEKGVSSGIDL
jgi:receptor expression-enhancing protein 1/2/3/4